MRFFDSKLAILTPIGKSLKQNSKEFQKLYFGNVTGCDLLKKSGQKVKTIQ